eukprot:gnl/TRDRNA2_/TRDRNA2_44516_c0_seq1.p1 gnl/TRDRNA2_/TRDRNA2_44516_c0~~gnl/TRDRNA2_/TRDRNA2_44516_c0_seq1.p1  ORF type:complete len:441 (-),score=64.66 gnl/TRDRNA2_/TRDRNA2_44516_c0_seq1:183-1505(-)
MRGFVVTTTLLLACASVFGVRDAHEGVTSLQSISPDHYRIGRWSFGEPVFHPDMKSWLTEEFKSASEADKVLEVIGKSVHQAQILVKHAIYLIESDDVEDELETWFGSDSDEVETEVRAMLYDSMYALTNMYLVHQPVCSDQSTVAFVMGGQRVQLEEGGRKYIVNMCKQWFYRKTVESLFGTLIHESIHHFGPTDIAYGRMKCQKLAKRSEDGTVLALDNADSFAWFVLSLATKEERMTPPSYRPECRFGREVWTAERMCKNIEEYKGRCKNDHRLMWKELEPEDIPALVGVKRSRAGTRSKFTPYCTDLCYIVERRIRARRDVECRDFESGKELEKKVVQEMPTQRIPQDGSQIDLALAAEMPEVPDYDGCFKDNEQFKALEVCNELLKNKKFCEVVESNPKIYTPWCSDMCGFIKADMGACESDDLKRFEDPDYEPE